MVMEKFVPNSYCVVCDPKTEEKYLLKNPYPAWQHFVLDWDDNGVCDPSDLHHTQTTDNSNPAPNQLVVNDRPHICWPADSNNPSMSEVHTDEPLWYITNSGNQSGHVYGYKTMIIIYNHS